MRRSPGYREIIRVEPRYIPVDSQDRVREVEEHHISTDSHGDIRRVSQQMPTNMSDSNRSTYVRSLPRREEVIVLSP